MEEPPSFSYRAERDKKYAIAVQNLSKSIGGAEILRSVYMHAEEGTVYGLLGPSGAGKTTLLNCILNITPWDSGEVYIFGKRVNKGKEIDPTILGYMPQDAALYEELTVKEMMRYFSQLYGMSKKEFDEVMNFLEDLMNLPGYSSRKIKTLSGGQQRRISLSLTLVHKPRLLILDEPTVGLDPLLRESLWNYLYNLTMTNKTTLVITTHYIEEVKRAHMVGVMRKGRLLVEDDPDGLMRVSETLILEEVVRKICFKDAQDHGKNQLMNNGKPRRRSLLQEATQHTTNLLRLSCNEDNAWSKSKTLEMNSSYPVLPIPPSETINTTPDDAIQVQIISKDKPKPTNNLCHTNSKMRVSPRRTVLSSVRRSLAYAKVVLINFTRSFIFAGLVLVLPPFQLFTTGTVFGVEPKFTQIGLVNHELENWQTECLLVQQKNISGMLSGLNSTTTTGGNGDECDLSLLSCHYIKHLYTGDFIQLFQFTNVKDALHAVEKGDIKGFIQIPSNFSEHIIERAVAIQFASEETINGTTILMDFDLTDFIKMYRVTMQMFQAFNDFVKELSAFCNFDLRLIDIPFKYRHPVYGTLEGTAQEYALPAMIAGILFEISFCVTPLFLVKEIKTGTFERSRVAGLYFSEFMAGLFLTMTAISLVQGLICYVSMEYGLDIKVHGNPALYFVLCVVSVLCGGTFGFFIGITFKDELTVIISAIFILPILMLYVGMLRPEEIIAFNYRSVVYYFFPSAAIVKSFRFVINRGAGLFHIQVWPGILITLAWAGVFCLLTMISIRRSKS